MDHVCVPAQFGMLILSHGTSGRSIWEKENVFVWIIPVGYIHAVLRIPDRCSTPRCSQRTLRNRWRSNDPCFAWYSSQLVSTFPCRSLAFATFSAGAPVGAVFGTAVEGVLTEFTHKTWRSSFYLFSGLTVLCFIGGLFSIDKDIPSNEKDRRIDCIGAFLVTGGLVLIVFVLSQGEIASDKWATPNYMGYSAMDTVVRLLPMFVSGMACNLFVGLMAAHVPIVWLVGTGAGATAIACMLFAIIDPKTTSWAYTFNASYISVMGADFVLSSGTLLTSQNSRFRTSRA